MGVLAAVASSTNVAAAAVATKLSASRAASVAAGAAKILPTAHFAKFAKSSFAGQSLGCAVANADVALRAEPRARTVVTAAADGDAVGAASGGGLSIDLRGKRAFIAGVADDQGFGWAIAKHLAEAGAEVLVGTWVPALSIFETSLRRGKFDESRKLADGSLFNIAKVYPMDAVFDTLDDVPEEIRTNKRYAGSSGWTVEEVAAKVKADYGSIDILVHSLANGPEVTKDLLDTSRKGYLAALSASSFSFISLVQRFGPITNKGGSVVSLTYIASEQVIPGYGGGMSSAKAALESDTRVLAWEAGRKYGIRVNTISAGPLRSRAAKAIGFIDNMINYAAANSPLPKELDADEVGATAAFLASPLASAITGVTLYVDNGLHAMGVAVDSPAIANAGKE
ncbi:hypothetical protein CLOM_g7190 [Closterium sp. NIES-68]|nr:hypothetical protein CLOM_g7190 [Closterium sp. NIES-68]GJP60754.1 hypothetical protein CLOP_g17981 [Closterium sp. NIES-67]GJP79000.1 hypothetical protein CLOP_g9254 [Closterium sp. NIES-67]